MLNLSSTKGVQIYSAGCARLRPDGQEYNCLPETAQNLIRAVSVRAQKFGWAGPIGILCVPKDLVDPLSVTMNLLTNQAEVKVKHLRNYVTSYILKESCAAQNDMMLYECLWNTLSVSAQDMVGAKRYQYHVHNQPSGVMLFKVVIGKCSINSLATVQILQQKLQTLPEAMADSRNNIDKFNLYVKNKESMLAQYSKKPQNFIFNLLKGYKSVPDKEFGRSTFPSSSLSLSWTTDVQSESA